MKKKKVLILVAAATAVGLAVLYLLPRDRSMDEGLEDEDLQPLPGIDLTNMDMKTEW